MTRSKSLFFIPILARAVRSKDQQGAMAEAFDEITRLGKHAEYKEGFRQFQAFINAAIEPFAKQLDERAQFAQEVVYRIIFDLVTDTFEGSEEQKQNFIDALNDNPRWKAELERINSEAKYFWPPDSAVGVEVVKGGQVLYSYSLPTDILSIGPISPGNYTVRLSNGRVLWQGDLRREDLIWAYAYPQQDLPMAAETEDLPPSPTRTIGLLAGELTMEVFAGLESGRIALRIEKRI
jgi:hypothetical protein